MDLPSMVTFRCDPSTDGSRRGKAGGWAGWASSGEGLTFGEASLEERRGTGQAWQRRQRYNPNPADSSSFEKKQPSIG